MKNNAGNNRQRGGRNSSNNNSNNNDSQHIGEFEGIDSRTRAVLFMLQFIQTATILFLTWVVAKGEDNWLGNFMPDPGNMVFGSLMFLLFSVLWVQRIRVLSNAK